MNLSYVWQYLPGKTAIFTSRNTYMEAFGEIDTILFRLPAIKISSRQDSGLTLILCPCLLFCSFNLWIQPLINAVTIEAYGVNNFMAHSLADLNQFQFPERKGDKLNTQWSLFSFCDLNWFPVLNLYFLLIDCSSKTQCIFKM